MEDLIIVKFQFFSYTSHALKSYSEAGPRTDQGGNRMGLVKIWKGQEKVSLILALAAMILASPTFGLNSEQNRATLRGLHGVRVLVEDLIPEVERSGLTKNRLQTFVETRLRKAGIKVLTQEECFATPGEPYLYVNINLNTGKAGDEICAYSIDIGVIQNAFLQRDPKQKTYVVTWSAGGVGLIEKEFLNRLQDSAEDLVSIFINAYLSVNPKLK
jgi:hypothetical protein